MIEMLIAYQLLISSYNVFAQNDSPESKRIVLTLEVNPQRDKYEDLDIVQLRLRLINNSSSSITLTEIPVVGHGIKVQMAAPESEFQEIYSFIDGNCRPAGLFPNIVIEPQQAFQSTIYVSPALHSKDGFAPASIGTWRIRAIFTDKQSERVVESKQVTIQLTKSEPVSDGGLFRSKEWHRLVLAGGSTPDKEVKQFRDFLLGSRTVPNSPLLALMVGRNYEKGVQKTKVVRGISRDGVPQFGEAVVWEANYPSAIQAYMVAADSKDSYIRSTALERLAECYIALNQFKDALRYLKQVLREDCDTMTRDNCVKLLHLVSEAIEDREPREKNEDK